MKERSEKDWDSVQKGWPKLGTATEVLHRLIGKDELHNYGGGWARLPLSERMSKSIFCVSYIFFLNLFIHNYLLKALGKIREKIFKRQLLVQVGWPSSFYSVSYFTF